jgi:glycine cleavage system transcriptional repressor
MPVKNNYLVISALGQDRPGIVDSLSGAVLEHGCNIVDSRMTVLGGEFAVLLMVAGPWNTLAKIEGALPELEQQLGMRIISKRTEGRVSGKSLIPYAVDVVALDHPGIVKSLAAFFSKRSINIEDLSTTSYAAAHTGTPMFAVSMTVGIPADTHLGTLREEFMEYCDSLNLDAVLEPVKN